MALFSFGTLWGKNDVACQRLGIDKGLPADPGDDPEGQKNVGTGNAVWMTNPLPIQPARDLRPVSGSRLSGSSALPAGSVGYKKRNSRTHLKEETSRADIPPDPGEMRFFPQRGIPCPAAGKKIRVTGNNPRYSGRASC
jgi:hypothetical protein